MTFTKGYLILSIAWIMFNAAVLVIFSSNIFNAKSRFGLSFFVFLSALSLLLSMTGTVPNYLSYFIHFACHTIIIIDYLNKARYKEPLEKKYWYPTKLEIVRKTVFIP